MVFLEEPSLCSSPTSHHGCCFSPGTCSVPYLSVIATCSSMAEPVLAFQFPEMEVLLHQNKQRSEGMRGTFRDACHGSALLLCFGC